MKRLLLTLFALMFASRLVLADAISQWSFNSVPPDASVSTGTNTPSIGNGTASLIGGVTATFAGGGGADPAASADDSAWNTKSYPVQGSGNKTGGVQFDVSTVGYSNIVVRWDHFATKTASKYFRPQYCTDGNTFIDFPTPVIIQADSKFEAQTNNLASMPGVNNNPNFKFRIVSEFESSAIGSGFTGYVPVTNTSTYDPSGGGVRFEYVTIMGTPIPDGNTPPTISPISNQTIRVTKSTGPLAFTVLDAEEPASNLTVNGISSNPAIISASNIAFGGSGANRTVNITASLQTGSATISVWAIDTGGKSNSTSFTVTVLASNTAPVLSAFTPTNTVANTPTTSIPFTVSDGETPASNLVVSATSANPGLLPNANIVFGGSGTNRSVVLIPAANQSGVAPVTIGVSDGTNSAVTSFALMVRPSSSVVFYEPFDYPNGSLLTNSAFLWANRSGVDGECQVTNGQLQVTADQSEDVIARLAGAPYNTGTGAVLYTSFKVKFYDLPNSTPDYFAHLANGTTLRDRIYAFIPVGGNFGFFRLAIGNGTNSAEIPIDITTNTTYSLVTRYNIDTATSTLWLNPSAETDLGASANDVQTPIGITSFGFRQDSAFDATVFIDDLKVGVSFASVTTTTTQPPPPIRLSGAKSGNNLILTWSNPAFSLESAPAPAGPFTNVPSASSPFSNPISGAAKFFRLKAN
ncbi:MAG TPA: hypothetical protein VLT36_14260 [Candidatus Dormibacteraeota bacterium]|nr:hypothetical protein [Candidatus Dormibacteraeota bacterium]